MFFIPWPSLDFALSETELFKDNRSDQQCRKAIDLNSCGDRRCFPQHGDRSKLDISTILRFHQNETQLQIISATACHSIQTAHKRGICCTTPSTAVDQDQVICRLAESQRTELFGGQLGGVHYHRTNHDQEGKVLSTDESVCKIEN
jgi:hypothetical protein